MSFYTLAWNSKDEKEFVLSSDEQVRIFAEIDIIEQAKQNGLHIDLTKIYMTGGGKQGETLTKAYKERKRLRTQGRKDSLVY